MKTPPSNQLPIWAGLAFSALLALPAGAGAADTANAANAANAPNSPAPPASATDFSAAERLLFMGRPLRDLKPPLTLQYRFRKRGSLEPGFDDQVSLALAAEPDGSCCAAKADFLTGERRLTLPEIPAADGNPVILYFLERDVREMQRLTKGSQFHFRQRIRMTVYQGATVRDVSLRYRGAAVAGREIVFAPFLDDPNRPRFEKFARKEYRFLLADAVPGGVYGIRTRVPDGDAAAAPLIAEELVVDGAEPSPDAPAVP